MKDVRYWVGMAVLGLVVIFTVQNIATVEVGFLFWSITLPKAIVLFLMFAAGSVFGWIFRGGRNRKRRDFRAGP